VRITPSQEPLRLARCNCRCLQYTFHLMEPRSIPSLLPILRSQQQGQLLARLLGDSDLELSLTDLGTLVDMPLSSVYREIERAESAGLVSSRKVGNTRLVSANVDSPYYEGLADVLVKAFGPPVVLAELLAGIGDIDQAFIYGSWAARFIGASGQRPVGDIDLLVLGSPDRTRLYLAASRAEQRLGRPVQVTIRDAGWLTQGTGNFHATLTERPMVRLDLSLARSATAP